MLKSPPAAFSRRSEAQRTEAYDSSSLAAALLGARRVPARQGWAGEKSGLFEHPETIVTPAL